MLAIEHFFFELMGYWLVGFVPAWAITMLVGRNVLKFVYVKLAISFITLVLGVHALVGPITYDGNDWGHYIWMQSIIGYAFVSVSVLTFISVFFQRVK